VRSRGLGVHVGGRNRSRGSTPPQDFVDLLDTRDVDFQQTLDVDATVLLLVHRQVVVLWHQQITNAFHVNLHVANSNRVLDVAGRCEDACEDLLNDTGNDTLADVVVDVATHHGVRFSGTRLSIGKDGTIVTVEDIVDGRTDRVVEDVDLARAHVEDSVEGEGPGGLLGLHEVC
jgi:hypothetical protein